MPVMKVKGGYRWGKKGKVYKTKAEAERLVDEYLEADEENDEEDNFYMIKPV